MYPNSWNHPAFDGRVGPNGDGPLDWRRGGGRGGRRRGRSRPRHGWRGGFGFSGRSRAPPHRCGGRGAEVREQALADRVHRTGRSDNDDQRDDGQRHRCGQPSTARTRSGPVDLAKIGRRTSEHGRKTRPVCSVSTVEPIVTHGFYSAANGARIPSDDGRSTRLRFSSPARPADGRVQPFAMAVPAGLTANHEGRPMPLVSPGAWSPAK